MENPGIMGRVMAVAAFLLAAALAWRAVEAHRANAELYRRTAEAEAEQRRLEEERERLKAERRALEGDPQYVERKLRELRQAEPGERIIERR
jgi:cell division protein FtsB